MKAMLVVCSLMIMLACRRNAVDVQRPASPPRLIYFARIDSTRPHPGDTIQRIWPQYDAQGRVSGYLTANFDVNGDTSLTTRVQYFYNGTDTLAERMYLGRKDFSTPTAGGNYMYYFTRLPGYVRDSQVTLSSTGAPMFTMVYTYEAVGSRVFIRSYNTLLSRQEYGINNGLLTSLSDTTLDQSVGTPNPVYRVLRSTYTYTDGINTLNTLYTPAGKLMSVSPGALTDLVQQTEWGWLPPAQPVYSNFFNNKSWYRLNAFGQPVWQRDSSSRTGAYAIRTAIYQYQ